MGELKKNKIDDVKVYLVGVSPKIQYPIYYDIKNSKYIFYKNFHRFIGIYYMVSCNQSYDHLPIHHISMSVLYNQSILLIIMNYEYSLLCDNLCDILDKLQDSKIDFKDEPRSKLDESPITTDNPKVDKILNSIAVLIQKARVELGLWD